MWNNSLHGGKKQCPPGRGRTENIRMCSAYRGDPAAARAKKKAPDVAGDIRGGWW